MYVSFVLLKKMQQERNQAYGWDALQKEFSDKENMCKPTLEFVDYVISRKYTDM